MADARQAILEAVAAADRLHEKYGTKARIREGASRIDVFEMLAVLNIPVMFRPLKGLLGCYLGEHDPGVMLTTNRPLSVQRFTAAHELGHAVMKHQSSIDDEAVLNRAPFPNTKHDDLKELQANAFASQLLTPRWLITHHMKRQGWGRSDLEDPDKIYQLSLRMGSSFAATCYALYSHKAIGKSILGVLLERKPKSIKQKLCSHHKPRNWFADVWVLKLADYNLLLEGSSDDLVILELLEHAGSGYLWSVESLDDVGFHVVYDERETTGFGQDIGSAVARRIVAEPEHSAHGHVRLVETRPWDPETVPIHSFEFDVSLIGPLQAGLLPTQREVLLGQA